MKRLLFLFAVPTIYAGTLDLSYTVIGNGGFSQPIPGFSDDSLWYINNSNGLFCSALGNAGIPTADWCTQDGFNLGRTTGSALLSSVFSVSAGSPLKTTVNFLSNDYDSNDIAQVFLLRDRNIYATLYEATSVTSLQTLSRGSVLIPGSPGVTYTPDSATFQGDSVLLGDTQYLPTNIESTCLGVPACTIAGSTAWVTSSFTPEAGDYQMLFTVFNRVDYNLASGLAVQRVSVPEGPANLQILLDLIFVCIMIKLFGRRQCQRRSPD